MVCSTAKRRKGTQKNKKKVSHCSRYPARYRKAALLGPIGESNTQWARILACGVDDDFLVSQSILQGLSYLINCFLCSNTRDHKQTSATRFEKCHNPQKRKPTLTFIDLLGLVLRNLRSKATLFTLCLIFGLTDSGIGVRVDYAHEVMVKVVTHSNESPFWIKWPHRLQMKSSVRLLEQKRENGRLLKAMFGVTDGRRMPCATFTEVNLQNNYFETFTKGVEVTNLFVFSFLGELRHAAVNHTGSWNDTTLAKAFGLYYKKLDDEYNYQGSAILDESAFVNNKKVPNGKILRGIKTNESQDIRICTCHS